eukprot:CAMPEP_0194153482 /NCGR_PEP_ID=MMETSP0152-20130528/56573_1 /TAXON_ID=1049557 /ORGANISM="Thalassiothrix antarctica, Strain L6-D1" /LENGTH=67 /DNA_ID=CAMNT_0038858799 /DNA_START=64 /DNA_END=263 /DNA_ORIENTATION=-
MKQHSNENPNADPYLQILNVEELYLKKSQDNIIPKIVDACNSAIELQKEKELFHLEALANERAGCIL